MLGFRIAKYVEWQVEIVANVRFDAIDDAFDRYFPGFREPIPQPYRYSVSATMNGIPHRGGPIYGWDISSEGDVERAAGDMKDKISEIILPFFQSLSTLDDLRKHLESEDVSRLHTSDQGRAEALLLCYALANDARAVRQWIPKLRAWLATRADGYWLPHFESFFEKFFADYPHLRP